MRYFDRYKHLLNLPYDDGDADCYGLVRRFYADNYGIELPNYARSSSFFSDGIDLVTPFIQEEDFKVVDCAPSRLEVGDGLLLCVPGRQWPEGMINHIAVFVGNGTFLHHLYLKPSCEDYMSPSWSRRIMGVLRHPEIAEKNAAFLSQDSVDLLTLLPDHVKRKHGI